MNSSRIRIFILCLVVLATLFTPNGLRIFEPTVQELDKLAYWSSRIAAVGAVRSYAEMASSSQNDSDAVRHARAHVYGMAAYRAIGDKAFSICDSSNELTVDRTRDGCIHQVMSTAISEKGFDAIRSLLKNCTRVPKNDQIIRCNHSLGHGLVMINGYDIPDLKKTLSDCEKYSSEKKFCQEGAFMEFNLRFGWAQRNLIRKVSNSHLLSPCDEVPREYIPACTQRITELWYSQFFKGMQIDAVARGLGDMCTTALDQVNGDQAFNCFSGIGHILWWSNTHQTLESASALCALTSKNPDNILLCIQGEFSSYTIEERASLEQPTRICSEVPQNIRARCNQQIRDILKNAPRVLVAPEV